MKDANPGELGLLSLSHVSLSTENLEDTERFYIEILGAKKVFDFSNTETGMRYGTFMSLGNGTFVEIFSQHGLTKSSSAEFDVPFRHLCLQVRSIKDAADWLDNFGYKPQIKIGKVDRVPQFFINGPDGVEIEFHEYSERSLQRNFIRHAE